MQALEVDFWTAGLPLIAGAEFSILLKRWRTIHDILSILGLGRAYLKKVFWGYDRTSLHIKKKLIYVGDCSRIGGTIGYVGTSTIYHQGGTLQQGNPQDVFQF